MKKIVKGFIGVLVIATISLVSLFVFRNQIVENVIEKLGAVAAGAKVEVDGVKTFLIEGRLRWDRIQVTDKDDTWKNLFETGRCEFGLEFMPLIAGKFIVETMVVDDLKTGTKRTTDGKIQQSLNEKSDDDKPSWIKSYAVKQLEKEKKNIPILDPEMFEKKINTDEIIAALELITPGNVEKLKVATEERYKYWNAKLEKNNYEERVKEISKDVKAINLNKIKNIDEFQKNISKAEKIIKESKKLRKEIKKEKKELKSDLKKIKNSAKQIPSWIKEDYETALKKAKFTDFSAENISKLLFGDRVTSVILMALENIEKSRQLATVQPTVSKTPEKEKMPSLPGFWIKKMNISTNLQKGLLLDGVVTDLSSNQQRTGKPFCFDLSGQSEKTGVVSIKGVMDYRNDTLSDTLGISVLKFPVSDVKLADSSIFPKKIKSGNCNFSADVVVKKASMNSKIAFHVTEVEFDYSTIKNREKKAAQIAKRVAEKVSEISVKCSAVADNDSMDLSLDSNIDEVLSAEVKRIVADEIENAKIDLKKKLNKKLGNYQGDFAKQTGVKEKELNELFALLDNDSAGQEKVIDSKKKTLEKKLKKKLKKKAKKAGKDLIKKLKIKF